MNCPHCDFALPNETMGELLAFPVEEDALLRCGKCTEFSMLAGGRMQKLTEEYIATLDEETLDGLIEAILRVRSMDEGPEHTLELLEKIRDRIKAARAR